MITHDVTLELRNGVLLDRDGVDPNADLLLTLDRATFNEFAASEGGFEMPAGHSNATLTGDAQTYREFWGYFDTNVFADRVVVR